MKKSDYIAIINYWRIRYPPPKKPLGINLAEKVVTTCFRCNKHRKLQRHHTGKDLTFAFMFPDIFVSRYLEYHEEDVELLCSQCHKDCHRRAYKTKIVWYQEGDPRRTPEWARETMQAFRLMFYEWASKYKPRRKKENGIKNTTKKSCNLANIRSGEDRITLRSRRSKAKSKSRNN